MAIKTRFERFTRNIKPTDDHIAEANRQTDYMVEQLQSKVADDATFTLVKILKAGSNAKFTSLRKTDENRFDVDLGAYYSGTGATKAELDTLLEFTCKQVRAIYPTKKADEFEILKSAVRIKFVSGIKLWVDLTPIIQDGALEIENGGWIPRPDGWRLTSVTCHNNFVASRTAESNKVPGPVKFNRLVRMIKWWNNLQTTLTQPSIFCELLAAAAFRETGLTGDWQTSLRKVFDFLRKHQLAKPILFSDYYDSAAVVRPKDPVVILDSVNPNNNITSTWTTATREAFLDRVQDTYDAMTDARSAEIDGDEGEAIGHWCRVFGDAFRTLSEDGED